MRSVSVFIFGVMTFLVLIALGSLLLPSNITVSKTMLINAKTEKVRPQIENFSNWKSWYPVMQKDNVNMITNGPSEITLRDETGKQISLKIMPSTMSDTIHIEVRSLSSTKIYYQFILRPQKDGNTQLTLNVNTRLKWYPWEKLKGIMLDKISGPEYELATRQLKAAVEK